MGKPGNGERTSLNEIRLKTYTIKPTNPIYDPKTLPVLEESRLRYGWQGQRKARATWTNGFSRLDVGRGDTGDLQVIG